MRERMSNIGGVVVGVAMSLSLLPLEAMAQQSIRYKKLIYPVL